MRNLISAGIRKFMGTEPELGPGPLEAKVVAVTTSKGGVGKTTTAVHLATGLAMYHGYRVLLIDLDPQGHVARSLSGVMEGDGPGSLTDLLLEGKRRQVMTLASSTRIPGLEVVSGDPRLAEAESLLSTRIGKEFLLRGALKITRTHYHAIVIDCPPNLGNLTLNALLAADGVVVPLDLSMLSLQGVQDLMDTIETVAERLGHELEIFGILRTRVDRRNVKVNRTINQALEQAFGPLVLESTIGVSTGLVKAQMAGRPVMDMSPGDRAAQDYRALVDELVRRMGLA